MIAKSEMKLSQFEIVAVEKCQTTPPPRQGGYREPYQPAQSVQFDRRSLLS
jgi:hypothetical protein